MSASPTPTGSETSTTAGRWAPAGCSTSACSPTHPLVTVPVGFGHGGTGVSSLVAVAARDAGRLSEPVVRDLIGEARMLDIVDRELRQRIGEGIATEAIVDQSAAITRLFSGVSSARIRTIGFEVAGTAGAAWTDDDGRLAFCTDDYLMRQVSCIGGGTTEMARQRRQRARARDAPRAVTRSRRTLPRRAAGPGVLPLVARRPQPAGQASDLVSRYWSKPAIPF